MSNDSLITDIIRQIVREEINSTFESKLQKISAELNSLKELKPSQKAVLTVDEAAEYMGRAKRSVLAFIRQGRLPSYKNGKRRFIKTEDIMAFLLKNKSLSADEIEYETAKNIYTRSLKKSRKIAG